MAVSILQRENVARTDQYSQSLTNISSIHIALRQEKELFWSRPVPTQCDPVMIESEQVASFPKTCKSLKRKHLKQKIASCTRMLLPCPNDSFYFWFAFQWTFFGCSVLGPAAKPLASEREEHSVQCRLFFLFLCGSGFFRHTHTSTYTRKSFLSQMAAGRSDQMFT